MTGTHLKMTYDQMGCEVAVPRSPRIISLVPSQTELLFDLGLGDQVVGLTRFCIHPGREVKKKQVIGGTKRFHLDRIDQLKPDLIIGNKEENYQEGIEMLKRKYPVWMSDITTLDDATEMITAIGEMTDTAEKARSIAQRIKAGIAQLKKQPARRVLYFIWKNPFMVAGANTFIDEMITRIGLINLAGSLSRYPELTTDQIKEFRPDLIFLSSEPYPFKEKHIREFEQLCPGAQVKTVDGEMFSWYGSRLLPAIDYFNNFSV